MDAIPASRRVKACTFDDDFNTVAPYIEEADAVILATPTYWFSIPGKVKCLIDKLYSFCVGKKKPLPVKSWPALHLPVSEHKRHGRYHHAIP